MENFFFKNNQQFYSQQGASIHQEWDGEAKKKNKKWRVASYTAIKSIPRPKTVTREDQWPAAAHSKSGI